VFPKKFVYLGLAISLVLILGGFGLSAFGPQGHVLESSRSCPRGGTYYSHILTSLCGNQYDVCVSFDYNCANDYHPPQVDRTFPIYGGESAILILAGLIGIVLGLWLRTRT
jgi:hypothetical protein